MGRFHCLYPAEDVGQPVNDATTFYRLALAIWRKHWPDGRANVPAGEQAAAGVCVWERLAWERHILGMPVSVNPLETFADRPENCCPLPDLSQTGGRLVEVIGFRLPGWTGGPGFFLSDGRHYLIARLPQGAKAPKSWAIVRGRGRWRGDAWGGGWLELVGV